MPGLNGKSYRGMLVQDTANPGTRYQVGRSEQVRRTKPKMPSDRHFHELQGSETFNFEVEQTERQTALFAKFRNCQLTHAQVVASAERITGVPKTSEGRAEGHAGTGSGDTEVTAKARGNDADDESDGIGEEAEVADGGVAAGPIHNPGAAALRAMPSLQGIVSRSAASAAPSVSGASRLFGQFSSPIDKKRTPQDHHHFST